MTTLQVVAIGVLGLIGIGVYGLLISRSLIKIVVALQILVKGAMLALVAAASLAARPISGKAWLSR